MVQVIGLKMFLRPERAQGRVFARKAHATMFLAKVSME